ncbi:MAG: helix-turn-helix transcriptional regulator [Methylococcales bacterium]|nr:helix-turn-helix transcriptional regulator [Methylococcales bacterium]
MKQSNGIAYLRQLCCSGLPKEIVVPEFLRAVQKVLPSGNNVLTVVDGQFNPVSFMLGFAVAELDETTPAVVCDFFTPERMALAAAWFVHQPVLVDAGVFDEGFYMTDMYNLVFRRYDQHHVLWGLVGQHSKPLGLLGLYRPRQQKAFNKAEQALFSQLLPYVAHAMQVPMDNAIRYSEAGLSGMMVMDVQGEPLFISPEAKCLLALATQTPIAADARIKQARLLAAVGQLCRNLDTVFRGLAAAPPSWDYTAQNGRFIFRAYWLNQYNNGPGGLIGITIEHQEPALLKILRALQLLPLSPMQKEVCLLLAQGYSNEKIGERLHIKLTTVKDHVSKLFTKLDIHQREELLAKLLALESSALVFKGS